MKIKQFLRDLGASDKESLVFMKLLELGAQPIGAIAKYLQLPRSSTYLLVDRLRELSLAETFEHHGIIYAQCIPVSDIGQLLKNRENHVKQLENAFLDLRSQLEGIESHLSITPQVKFYDRKSDAERMAQVILNAGDMDAIFNPEAAKSIMSNYYNTVPQKMKKDGVKFRVLMTDCLEAKIYKKLHDCPIHQVKILPPQMKFSTGLTVTKNVIYMVAYDGLQFSGIEIHNSFLAETHRQIFNQLWATC